MAFESAEDKQRAIMIAVLVLIIVGAAVGIVMSLGDSGREQSGKMGQQYWCLETQEEFSFAPDEAPEDIRLIAGQAGPGVRSTNPKTGRKTLISMFACPNCTKYFIPAEWKAAGTALTPDDPRLRARRVCPHCQTDMEQWLQEKYGAKK